METQDENFKTNRTIEINVQEYKLKNVKCKYFKDITIGSEKCTNCAYSRINIAAYKLSKHRCVVRCYDKEHVERTIELYEYINKHNEDDNK